MTNNHFPTVALLANNNSLTRSLIEELIAEHFSVLLITSDTDIQGFTEKQNLKIISRTKIKSNLSLDAIDYLICVNDSSFGVLDQKSLKDDVEQMDLLGSMVKQNEVKSLLVDSVFKNRNVYSTVEDRLDDQSKTRPLTAVIFVGDLINLETRDSGSDFIAKLVYSILNKEDKTVCRRYYYPQSPKETAGLIIRNLFSLKSYGNKTAILGKPIGFERLLEIVKVNFPRLGSDISIEVNDSRNLSANEIVYTKEDADKLLSDKVIKIKETKNFAEIPKHKSDNQNIFQKVPDSYSVSKEIKNTKKVRNFDPLTYFRRIFSFFVSLKKRNKNNVGEPAVNKTPSKILGLTNLGWKKLFFGLTIFILVSPFLFLVFASLSLSVARKIYYRGDLDTAEKIVKMTRGMSLGTNHLANFFVTIPVIRVPYKAFENTSDLLVKQTEIGQDLIQLTRQVIGFGTLLTGNENFNVNLYARNNTIEISHLYQELGFLDGEIESLSPFERYLLFNDKQASSNFRNRLLLIQDIVSASPVLLGSETPVKYLFLFQNDSITRPTGGVIDAYAIVTVSAGKLISVDFDKVSAADKNLTGRVEPPEVLEKHFGLDNWGLRDSNWEPNFVQSATKAEWFVDKELNQSVSGVIAVNTNFLKEYLKIRGAVEVGDYKVDNENMYRFINADLTRDLSDKKSDALLKELVQAIYEKPVRLNDKERIDALKLLNNSLENKDIQVFLHQDKAQESLVDIGWSGILEKPVCIDNCYSDLVALAETLPNESGSGITREGELTVNFEAGVFKRKYILFIKNEKPYAYKSYVRLLVNPDSSFSPVEIIGNDESVEVEPEIVGTNGRKEAGVFVEIPSGEIKALVYSWESASGLDLKSEGMYKVLLWKQPGISQYPFTIKFDVPDGYNLTGDIPLSLTLDGTSGYNTQLSKDISLSINIRKNE